MKKFVTVVVLFLLFIYIVDQLVGNAFDYMALHAKSGECEEINNLCFAKKYDVIIMGSSRASHHYVPAVLEDSLHVKCINAGRDGQGIILMYGLVSCVLERYNPKLIIYDIEPAFDYSIYKADNNRTRYISSLKPYYRIGAFKDIIDDISKNEIIKLHSGLYRYNSNLLRVYREYQYEDSAFETNNGYKPLVGIMKEDISAEDNAEKVIDNQKFEYLIKFIHKVKKKDIPVLFVASPKYKASDYYKVEEIRRICNAEGISFFDYYLDPKFQDRDLFYDSFHLNSEGAEIYTKQIINDINNYIDKK